MKNNQKRIDKIDRNNFSFLQQDRAINVLSLSVLLFSFILLFTACKASQTKTTSPNFNADTSMIATVKARIA